MAKKKAIEPEYILIPIEEFKALGKVNGEALRLYMAIRAYAYANRTVCWPSWGKIAKLMGPNKNGKLRHKSSFTRSVEELEENGLIKRGEWGGDRFVLTFKKKRVQEYFGDKEDSSEEDSEGSTECIPGVDNSYTGEVDNTNTPPIQNEEGGSTNRIPVKSNRKSNRKSNSKDTLSNEKKPDEYEVEIKGRVMTFRKLPPVEDTQGRWELLSKLEEGKTRWLWYYEPKALLEWLLHIEKRWPQIYKKSKYHLRKFLEEWNIEEIE